MKSNISFFVCFPFLACAFGIITKKGLPNPRSQRLTPKFYFKSFISLVITFNSMVLHDPF